MLFVALFKARPGIQKQATARRMQWQAPQVGTEAVAEYWLQTPDPAVISVFKADHIAQIWAAFEGWDDFYDISIYPAVSAQEGLELLKQFTPQ